MKTCTFGGCGRDAKSKGLCSGHYQQQRFGQELRPLAGWAKEARPCAFEGCLRAALCKGYCDGHYQQLRAGKRLVPLQQQHAACTFPGCGKPHEAKGLCLAHYSQQRAGLELRRCLDLPSPVEEVGEGAWQVTLYGAGEDGRPGAELAAALCIVSPEDVEQVGKHRWRLSPSGYAVTKIARKTTLLHRLILGLEAVPWEGEGDEGDHINGLRLDNRRGNLRIVSRAENTQNRGVREDSGTGHRNIHYDPEKKLYRVIVTSNGKRHGHRHSLLKDAVAEAEALRAKLFTHSNEIRVARGP